jgi:HK97 family phage major capsid protein
VVGAELLAGLIDAENAQLIAGTGVAPNLLGLTTHPSILTVGSAGTDLDAIAAAWLALRTGGAHTDPDVVVMHPGDWYSSGFLLAKDTAGQYLLGAPVTATTPMLWGVPVVVTEAMTEGTAMVANLKLAATAHVRQAPTVEVAPYGGGTTEFIANQTLVRAEERVALAIHHPKAICLVTAV